MTPKERAAMQQAIEFIVDCEYGKAELALREALDEQAEQEPTVSDGVCGGCAKKAADGWALYCVECWEKAEQEPIRLQCTTCGTVYANGVPPQVQPAEQVEQGEKR